MVEQIFLTEHHLAFILSYNYHNYLWPITLLMIQLATAIVPPPSSVHTRVFYLHWWNICICPLLLLRSRSQEYRNTVLLTLISILVPWKSLIFVSAMWLLSDRVMMRQTVRVRCIKWPVIISPGSTDTGSVTIVTIC